MDFLIWKSVHFYALLLVLCTFQGTTREPILPIKIFLFYIIINTPADTQFRSLQDLWGFENRNRNLEISSLSLEILKSLEIIVADSSLDFFEIKF